MVDRARARGTQSCPEAAGTAARPRHAPAPPARLRPPSPSRRGGSWCRTLLASDRSRGQPTSLPHSRDASMPTCGALQDRGILIGAVDRRVDRDGSVDRIECVRLHEQLPQHRAARAVAAEASVTLPRRLARPKLHRQTTPRPAGPVPIDDALHNRAMIRNGRPWQPRWTAATARSVPPGHWPTPRDETPTSIAASLARLPART